MAAVRATPPPAEWRTYYERTLGLCSNRSFLSRAARQQLPRQGPDGSRFGHQGAPARRNAHHREDAPGAPRRAGPRQRLARPRRDRLEPVRHRSRSGPQHARRLAPGRPAAGRVHLQHLPLRLDQLRHHRRDRGQPRGHRRARPASAVVRRCRRREGPLHGQPRRGPAGPPRAGAPVEGAGDGRGRPALLPHPGASPAGRHRRAALEHGHAPLESRAPRRAAGVGRGRPCSRAPERGQDRRREGRARPRACGHRPRRGGRTLRKRLRRDDVDVQGRNAPRVLRGIPVRPPRTAPMRSASDATAASPSSTAKGPGPAPAWRPVCAVPAPG